jgi:glycolate oxidase FAD binding subunit
MTTSATLEPGSIDELGEFVRAHNRGAIYPVGCGSWMDLGYPPTKPGVAISTKRLNRVVDYPHEELTITVEAGILVSELQRILAEKGQMFPIDCPHPENATLGGLLATNTSGPRRLAYGTARDSVLGLDVIDATGTRIHGGGRVVKNVAGYDLPKMHIGALGTLGIIVEATLKVRPMPERTTVDTFLFRREPLAELLANLRGSPVRPDAVEVECSNVRDDFRVSLAFEGAKEAVAYQLQNVNALVLKHATAVTADDAADSPERMQESTNLLSEFEEVLGAKMTTKPTHIPKLIDELLHELPTPSIKAHASSGIIWVFWNARNGSEAHSHAALIRGAVNRCGGRFSIPRCPDEWKRELPIWGDVGPEIEWMRRLRTALDPNRVINPGRFVVE